MKISLNSLRYYQRHYNWSGEPAPDGLDGLVDKIGAQLGGIEETVDVGSKYRDVVIVCIVSCVQHPNADRLHVCKIDDGGKTPGIARDENGHIQVVCGAPNVREGLLVAWLPPGSTVPESVGKDPFVLEARPLRGEISNGMLASPRELALGDSHEGILEIELGADERLEPGMRFADAYCLDGDVVIDIENKMFTHRPDCFGYIGIAREVAGIQGMPFVSPDWYRSDAVVPAIEAEPLPLTVRNDIPELVPRYTAIAVRDVQVKASPLWLQIDLAKVGLRPINNIVDYTNYYMLLTGQPLHAYDYDKVKALDNAQQATIVVRHPQPGETVTLLSGKTIEPRAEAMMIATDSRLIAVGGAMGGADTEVDDTTKNIIIEAANFDMYSVRRTSMAHGLFTDAVTRFSKGQSPLQTQAVLAKIVGEIRRFAHGKVAGEVIDDNHVPAEVRERNSLYASVAVTPDFINSRLGLELSAEQINVLLTNVEFEVIEQDGQLLVKAPFWRTDIEIPEDVVEEVGRLYGFDHLPLELPKRRIKPVAEDAMLQTKASVRQALGTAGANEVLTYSFVHGNLLEKVGQNKDQAFQIANALSPDLQYYRMSLTPSLLERIHPNIKAGYDAFALFELGKAHLTALHDTEGLPVELERLAFVYAAVDKRSVKRPGAPYYQARLYLEALLHATHSTDAIQYEPIDPQTDDQSAAYYEPGRAAVIRLGDAAIGYIGEYRASVHRALKLPAYSAGFELDLKQLTLQTTPTYTPLSKYPSVEQDMTLKVPAGMLYGQLTAYVKAEIVKHKADDLHVQLRAIDIYQGADDTAHKHVTYRLKVVSYIKTLRDSQVAALLDAVSVAAHDQFGAERI